MSLHHEPQDEHGSSSDIPTFKEYQKGRLYPLPTKEEVEARNQFVDAYVTSIPAKRAQGILQYDSLKHSQDSFDEKVLDHVFAVHVALRRSFLFIVYLLKHARHSMLIFSYLPKQFATRERKPPAFG